MCDDRLIVLKFGGSVLRDEATLPVAVHEIYRWRRDGFQVIAVVSALAGQTDKLLEKTRQTCDSASPETVTALVSTGELQSAALLGLHLDRAGVPACVLTPAAIGLTALGHPLDAMPSDLRTGVLRQALNRYGAAVIPGYCAQDREGRTVLLGRGGSDLTALFLSQRLGRCPCHLIKDVDGLYERDPADAGPRPRRFATATWEDALRTDGSIVQPKAIEFARARRLPFEIGRMNGTNPTRIGAGPTTFCQPERAVPLRVALLGLGTVGGGVFELLRQMPEQFEIVAIAVRDPGKARRPSAPSFLLTTDAIAAATCGADVIVEVMGGRSVAQAAIVAALRAGADVVTANKGLLSECGTRLVGLARSRRRSLRFSAAVGGSMPLLERVAALADRGVRSVRGIINGTTNFLLDRIAAGVSFEAALREAQRLGFTERDPSRDVNGLDAADKLCLIAQMLGGPRLGPADVQRDELSAESVRQARCETAEARVLRHVASLEFDGPRPRASVRLRALDESDPLACVAADKNATIIELRDGTIELVSGRGAGRWPTAEAVVADLLELSRARRSRDQRDRAPRDDSLLADLDIGPHWSERLVRAG